VAVLVVELLEDLVVELVQQCVCITLRNSEHQQLLLLALEVLQELLEDQVLSLLLGQGL
jgi:hypothetical protein